MLVVACCLIGIMVGCVLGNWLVDSCLLHMLVACCWFGVRCVVGVVGV